MTGSSQRSGRRYNTIMANNESPITTSMTDPSQNEDHQPMPDEVALCVTCLVDQLLPEIGVATVKVLRRAGYTVEFPAGQTCCGQPFFNSGFVDEAERLAKRLIELFEPYAAVVLPSGSCTTMIRKEYPHLFAGESEWQARARALADKTYELSELLHKSGWRPVAAGTEREITYHDSCHMNRMLGLAQEPRQVLAAAGCTVSEMEESDRCCGFGGLFSIRLAEVSNAMTTEKLRQASQSGATMLVTADPGCLMQMRGLAQDAHVQLEHLAIILEEATR
jgi:L-lactate dehydrogenase complex protein LldE